MVKALGKTINRLKRERDNFKAFPQWWKPIFHSGKIVGLEMAMNIISPPKQEEVDINEV